MQRTPPYTTFALTAGLVAGWFLFALVHAFTGGALIVGVPLLLFGLLARLMILRPWTDILAWGSAVVLLVLTGGPPEVGLVQIILTTLAIFLIVMGLHVPTRAQDARGLGVAAAWWGMVSGLVGLVAWWPVLSLEGKSIGVLDPATSVGMAVRLVSVLALVSLLVLGLSGLRARSARRLEREPESTG